MARGTTEIMIGNCLDVLRRLPEGHFHTVVTSPPYFGLRDYGVDGQIGLEPTPAEFVDIMVDVFREVRRVLRDDGTLWLNLGDTHHSGRGAPHGVDPKNGARRFGKRPQDGKLDGFKPKDLIGIPWRVAFALQADGWYLRRDIVWSKPNPMPESVRDRPTTAHEFIFLMSKSAEYFYDFEAVKEPASGTAHARKSVGPNSRENKDRVPNSRKTSAAGSGIKNNASFAAATGDLVDFRNKRSVWTVASEAFSEAHFATYPPALIEPCILAGSPIGGRVLDPFGGAGTTGLVSERLGRNATLIELNPEYAALATARLLEDAMSPLDRAVSRGRRREPQGETPLFASPSLSPEQ